MPIRSRVDPELVGVLDALVSSLGADFTAQHDASVRRARIKAFLEQGAAPAIACPEVARRHVAAPGSDGAPPVAMIVYTPPDLVRPTAAILHYHGGGFTVGSAQEDDALAAMLARDVGCVVVSADYRLAPETVHPGPVEDCYAALQWVAETALELGVDPARIAVTGASAGGALAANVALMARDRGGPAIAYQMLICPMLDDRMTAASCTDLDGAGVWNASANRNAWEALLIGSESGLRIAAEAQIARYAAAAAASHYAVAARVEDLAGLPPTFIDASELDILLDENIDYARRLIAAGVPVELHVHPQTYHAFERFVPEALISRHAIAMRVQAFRRALRLGAVT